MHTHCKVHLIEKNTASARNLNGKTKHDALFPDRHSLLPPHDPSSADIPSLDSFTDNPTVLK
jgi:hypothetical protein